MSRHKPKRFIFWISIVLAGGFVLAAAGYLAYPLYRHWQADRAVQLAKSFLERHETRSGLLSVQTALRHRPDHLEAHKVAAELLEASGSREALTHRRRLMELQPQLLEPKLDYARAALKSRNPQLAAKVLATLEGLQRETPEFLKLQADMFLVAGQTKNAATSYRKLLARTPNEDAVRVKLALIDLREGAETEQASARETLASFAEDEKLGLTSLRALTRDALARQDLPTALFWSERACSLPSSEFSDRLQRLQALSMAQSPDYESWLRRLEESASEQPQSAFQLGRWQLVTLGPEEALSWLQTLPKSIRDTPLIGILLADSYSALGRWTDLENLVRWTDWREAEPLRLAFLARAQGRQDKSERSEASWQLALAAAHRRPSQLGPLLNMARADGRDARNVLWLIAEKDPAQKWARKELYETYLKEKNASQMLRMMELVLKEDPQDQTAKYNVAGLLMLTQNQLARAGQLARELYEANPHSLRVSVLYAFALTIQGDAGKGAEILDARDDLHQLGNDDSAYCALIFAACGRLDEARQFAASADRQQLLPELRASLDQAFGNVAHGTNAETEHFEALLHESQ